MNIEKQPTADKIHIIRRKNKAGEERAYSYKLWRVIGSNGRVTTISMNHELHLGIRARHRVGQKEMSNTMRRAASLVCQSKTVVRPGYFSSKVIALAVRMLEAKRMNVTLDEFLYAEANNAAWQ